RTSLLAANLLEKKGVKAFSLDGGMKAWNYAWNKAEIEFENGTKVIQIRRAAKGVLAYMVGSSNEAIVIDASLDPQIYQDIAKDHGWSIKYVMDTHIHADYVSRTRELASKTGAKHLMIDTVKVDFEFTPIVTNQSIKFGASLLQFLHTPGHTWESTTFILDNSAVFTGDTLFIDGIGRPDLKAEQAEAIEKAKSLYKSLNGLLSLSTSLLVLPAHTSNTIAFDNKIIGDTIKNVSERVKQVKLSEDEFVDYALSRIPPTPPNYLTIAGINKTGVFDGQQLADLEAGGNHCAIK
ncbi:MAG: rhodanese, partial [Marivirga sp.]|nr:rhodanese [Marivirga sp.]